MLYYNFKNYEEFKEIFGIIEHGNGVKSRKNKIMLALWKDRRFLRTHIRAMSWDSYFEMSNIYRTKLNNARVRNDAERFLVLARKFEDYASKLSANWESDLLDYTDMVALKCKLYQIMSDSSYAVSGASHRLVLNSKTFYSTVYKTDSMAGICEDGTTNAIRYINTESGRIFKMKAGKMFNHLLSCNKLTEMLPEQIKRWLGEEFVAEWILYAREISGSNGYTLHVDDNFKDIYSGRRLKGNFRSCMVGNGYYSFYSDAVKAKAAYLTDEDGMIVARCIIFTDVTDEDGKTWRLAERQYSSEQDLSLQRMLVSALIRGGYIDGFKSVGASCSDAQNFVDNNGNSLRNKIFSIECNLETSDYVSYQDSFKYYDYNRSIAYNSTDMHYDYELDVTSGTIEEEQGEWSHYNDEYIPREEACYVETRDDYFYNHQVVYAYRDGYQEDCFQDDCLEINGTYYYAGRNCDDYSCYGISYCEECGEYYLDSDSYYSDITEEYYCSDYCRDCAEQRYKEDNWHYSEYDDDYVEDEDEITIAVEWSKVYHEYRKTTIFCETLDELMDSEKAVEIDGVNYIDDIGFDGEPVHFAAAQYAVA